MPFVDLERLQSQLRVYAAALLGDWERAEDIVQDANLYMISNADDFQPGTNFRAWAYSVIRFTVLAWKRDRSRDREDLFSEATLEAISEAASAGPEDADVRAEALKACLAALSKEDIALLEWKYVERRNLADLARGRTLTVNSYHQKISRLRLALRTCILKKMRSSPTIHPEP